MEMKIINCSDPEQNPAPMWLHSKRPVPPPEPTLDPVERFKRNPDSFFPDMMPKAKR